MKNATIFLPSPEYKRLSFTKKFGSRMEHKLFDGWDVLNVSNRSETLNLEVIYFLLCAVFWHSQEQLFAKW